MLLNDILKTFNPNERDVFLLQFNAGGGGGRDSSSPLELTFKWKAAFQIWGP